MGRTAYLLVCLLLSCARVVQGADILRGGSVSATPDSTVVSSGARVYASIRPEDVQVFTEPLQDRENVFKGTIAHKAYLGNFLFFFVRVNDTMIRVQVAHHLPQEEGQELYLFLDPQKCMILS